MQKNHFLISIILITATLFSFSCKNFMQGKDFVEELDTLIWLSSKERPTAKIISPVSAPAGDYKNSSIIIKFSKKIDPETFENGFSVTNNTGDSLRDYYSEAQWDEEGLIVTVPAKEFEPLPIPSGTYMDITISLTTEIKDIEKVPLAERVSETYKLNSTLDKEAPFFIFTDAVTDWEDFFVEVKDEEGNVIKNPKFFIEGEITDENQDDLLPKNHICKYFSINAGAHDYGSQTIFANISIKRVFDIDGNEVSEEIDNYTQELTYLHEDSKDKSEIFYISLWDGQLSDGIYKVEVFLLDAANNKSEESKVYYVVRDSSFFINPYASARTWLPSWREDDPETDMPQTLDYINQELQNFDIYGLKNDTYITYKNKTYTTRTQDFKYKISYGLSKNDENKVTDIDIADSCIFDQDSSWMRIVLPKSFMEYKEQNKTKDIYLEVKIYDAVGNFRTREMYFPRQPEFFCSTYDASTETITLNYEDQSSMTDVNATLEGVTTYLKYRVLYAQKDSSKSLNTTVLTRNFAKPHSEDEWNTHSDKQSFKINDASKEYYAVIIPCYDFDYNYQNIGRTFGVPLVINTVKATIANNAQDLLDGITISATHTTPKDQSGLSKISISADLPKRNGISYFYGWSTNHNPGVYEGDWNYFSTKDFTVSTYLEPPAEAWAKDPNIDNIKKGLGSGWPQSYTSTAYAAVFATDGATISKKVYPVTFDSSEDNIPPKVDNWIKAHNMVMSADGTHFFTPNTIVKDEEWNNSYAALYHYAPYSSLWGDSTKFYTTNEIYMHPWAFTSPLMDVWVENDENNNPAIVRTNLKYDIPVNGLKDGEYVFFFNYNDAYGNNASGTIGKVNIGTYKNKPTFTYNKNSNSLSVELEADNTEIRQNNKAFIQYLANWTIDPNEPLYHWSNVHETQGGQDESNPILQVTKYTQSMSNNNGKLSYTTDSAKAQCIIDHQNTFYKVTVTGYDYDVSTGLIIDDYGWIVGDPDYYSKSGYDDEKYDMFTKEMASVPSFIYIGNYDSYDKTLMEKETSTIYSNIPVLVMVYSSIFDLGDNIEEWERRGNLLSVRMFDKLPFPGDTPGEEFTYKTALTDISKQTFIKKCYFTIIAQFANGEQKISKVYAID